jgi:hypothetical protein
MAIRPVERTSEVLIDAICAAVDKAEQRSGLTLVREHKGGDVIRSYSPANLEEIRLFCEEIAERLKRGGYLGISREDPEDF